VLCWFTLSCIDRSHVLSSVAAVAVQTFEQPTNHSDSIDWCHRIMQVDTPQDSAAPPTNGNNSDDLEYAPRLRRKGSSSKIPKAKLIHRKLDDSTDTTISPSSTTLLTSSVSSTDTTTMLYNARAQTESRAASVGFLSLLDDSVVPAPSSSASAVPSTPSTLDVTRSSGSGVNLVTRSASPSVPSASSIPNFLQKNKSYVASVDDLFEPACKLFSRPTKTEFQQYTKWRQEIVQIPLTESTSTTSSGESFDDESFDGASLSPSSVGGSIDISPQLCVFIFFLRLGIPASQITPQNVNTPEEWAERHKRKPWSNAVYASGALTRPHTHTHTHTHIHTQAAVIVGSTDRVVQYTGGMQHSRFVMIPVLAGTYAWFFSASCPPIDSIKKKATVKVVLGQ
jgi:hypothetical protein